jgi:hypothetical protein
MLAFESSLVTAEFLARSLPVHPDDAYRPWVRNV